MIHITQVTYMPDQNAVKYGKTRDFKSQNEAIRYLEYLSKIGKPAYLWYRALAWTIVNSGFKTEHKKIVD